MKLTRQKACILGYPVDIIDKSTAIKTLCSSIEKRKSTHVITINPEMIFQANLDPNLNEILHSAELIIPDGVGIKLGLKVNGINIEQVPGIEFSESLLAISNKKGYSVGFLGASEEIINAATNEIQQKYPKLNIIFKQNGYFNEEEEKELIKKLKTVNPQILFVALGVPKQELWIARHREVLAETTMVGVGGSFDVWSKKIKRAPVLFRKFGLEWFYRLICQPSRFTRMFPTLPLFLVKVLLDNKNTGKI